MGPSPTYHPPEGEECETSVEHGLPIWAEPAVRYCSRRPRPSPMWGSCFLGARAVGPWVGEQKPLGKTPLLGNCSPKMIYLPTTTSEPTSPVRTPVLHLQHAQSGEPVAQSPDALARPASNNMPLSEHDTQELGRLFYLRAEGIERQERLQYLRQT